MKKNQLLIMLLLFMSCSLTAQEVTKKETIEYLNTKLQAAKRTVKTNYTWGVYRDSPILYREQSINHFSVKENNRISLGGDERLTHGYNDTSDKGSFFYEFNPTDVNISYDATKISFNCKSGNCMAYKTYYYNVNRGNKPASEDTTPVSELVFYSSSAETAKRIVKAYKHLQSFFEIEDPFADD